MSRKFVKHPTSVTASEDNLDLRDAVFLAVVHELENTISSLPELVAAQVEGYEESFNDASGSHMPPIKSALREAASEITYQMLLDCPFRSDFY